MGLWAVPWSSSLKGPQGARPCPGHPSSRGPGPSPDPGAHILPWLGLPPLPDLFQLEIQSVPGGLVSGPSSPGIRVGNSQNQHKWGLPKRA